MIGNRQNERRTQFAFPNDLEFPCLQGASDNLMATYSAGYGTFSTVLSKALKRIVYQMRASIGIRQSHGFVRRPTCRFGSRVVRSYFHPLLPCTSANKNSLYGRRRPTRYQARGRWRSDFKPRRPSTRRPTSYTRRTARMCPCSARKNSHCDRRWYPVRCGYIQSYCPWGIDVLCWTGSYLGIGGIFPIYPVHCGDYS